MDTGELVKLWGAKKLTEVNQPRYKEDIKIDPDTVEVRFDSEHGRAWSDVTFEDAYAYVVITGTGAGKAMYSMHIEPDEFDFAKVVGEIVALGDTLIGR